jgi:hypothetical protein
MVVTVRVLCGAYHFTVPTVNFVTVLTVLLNRFTMRPNTFTVSSVTVRTFSFTLCLLTAVTFTVRCTVRTISFTLIYANQIVFCGCCSFVPVSNVPISCYFLWCSFT